MIIIIIFQDLSRRRTPGGVYLQLLKTDPNVTDDDLKEIFEGEMTLDKKQRKRYVSGLITGFRFSIDKYTKFTAHTGG